MVILLSGKRGDDFCLVSFKISNASYSLYSVAVAIAVSMSAPFASKSSAIAELQL